MPRARLRQPRPLLLAFAAGIVLTLVPACAAPTLPLPPPTALVEGPPDASGRVVVRGLAGADAYVFALNEDRDRGVIGRADSAGAYTLEVEGSSGETLSIWQMSGTVSSALTTRIIP